MMANGKSRLSDSPLRIALLGCSAGPGVKHLEAWKHVEGVAVVVLAEKDAAWAHELARIHEIPNVCGDFREAITDNQIDIVDVALPIRFHAEAVLMALEAGRHVLCEKPMTETLEQAERIVEAAGKSNRVFGVNFQYRFVTHIKRIAELIQSGKIGRPVHWRMNLIEGSKDRAANTGYPGILEDCGIHKFDVATLVVGRPVRVQAIGMKLSSRPNLGDYDTGTAVITYEDGDQVAVHMCNGIPHGLKGVNSDEVLGPDGIIQYEPMAGDIWMDHSQFTWTDKDKATYTVKVDDWKDDWGLYRIKLCKHFVDCIRDASKNIAPLCDAEQGRLAMRMTKAVRESLDTGRTVELLQS